MTSAKYFDAISLVVTRSHSWSLVVYSWSLVVTCGHSWSLVVTRGHSWSCDDEKVRSLRDDLLNLLPVDGQPDFIHMVSHLPMTAHGKIDRNALLSNVQEMSISVAADMKSSREFLKYAWQDSLMVNKGRKRQDKITSGKFKKEPGKFIGENITEDDMFVVSGGTSLGGRYVV